MLDGLFFYSNLLIKKSMNLALGTLCLALCAWHFVLGTLCLALCAWHFVLGTLCLALCAWHFVRCALNKEKYNNIK